MPSYVVIGGGAYQPGSAAYKKALQLYAAMPKTQPTTQVPGAVSPAAPRAPSTFPTYQPTGGSASSGGGASLAPGPSYSGKGAYGLVPSVPNPISTAAGSISGNTANLPGLTTLGTQTTKLNADLGALPYQSNLPGYTGLLGQSSQNISSNLAGIIDPQEWTQLQQRMAERGATMGITPSSPNFNTALMTALDQSIAGRQNLGQQQLNAAIARTPTGQPFNTAGQQISPTDVQAAQYQANVLGAAPDPAQAAQANLDMLLKAIEAGRVGGLGGVGGGGGGGMPRLTAPGVTLSPVGAGGYSGGGYSIPGYAPRTNAAAPGVAPPALTTYLPQNPNTDYSVGPNGQPYPVDMTDYFNNLDQSYNDNWLENYLNDWEQGA